MCNWGRAVRASRGSGVEEGRSRCGPQQHLRLLKAREPEGDHRVQRLPVPGEERPGHEEVSGPPGALPVPQGFLRLVRDQADDTVQHPGRVVGMLDYGEVGKDLRWVVRMRGKKDEKVVEEVFDAVVVATGHYSHPRMPTIKGMDAWKRKQMHSHVYRVPDPFQDEIIQGQVVVVVGNSVSGREISMGLMNVAKEVYLSAKSTDNISQGLSKIESRREDGGVLFVDGSWVIADTILYCTG
ncbi:hypothetical protein CRG98_007475 [Punica granatum]|uniref:Flavin-containing monooxygenase n=1 Tax=Punica granatum TaxID=22663 RepID=A0A2I0KWC2_PUNGR|nr:hypothetical protein CRG98_007475 [Punica granatum]